MDHKTDENKTENYQFITEKRKNKPINKQKILWRVVSTVILAVVFGAVSAGVFTLMVRSNGSADTRERVDFTPEEQTPEDPVETDTSSDNATVSAESAAVEEVSQNEPEKEEAEDRRTVSAASTGTRIINNKIVQKVSIGISDYKKLYEDLYEAATRASRSIVTVTGISSDTDWFENTYENTDQASGLILADNGREFLIVVESKNFDEDARIRVEFSDGTKADGKRGMSDANTGLMIVGVEMDQIGEETQEEIREATLGNTSASGMVGEPIIAIGSPIGLNSIAYGFVTSTGQTLNMVDRNIHLVNTDIYGSRGASGVIVDYNGSVLGIITEKKSDYTTANLISAFAISDLRNSLEKISNGSSLVRLGIYGTDVPAEAMEEGVPEGVYVAEIVMDGPAMEAGIQSGDVITRIGTQEIRSFEEYEKILQNSQPNDSAVVTAMRYARGEYQEMTFDVTFDALTEEE
ncbi:MAG: PDZ domain-containing protein [Lachnospiraceae bacterium]|nr:PDZ domain-containing protein [Lachnospiraceae bacterium]